jgi:hypothetical protein
MQIELEKTGWKSDAVNPQQTWNVDRQLRHVVDLQDAASISHASPSAGFRAYHEGLNPLTVPPNNARSLGRTRDDAILALVPEKNRLKWYQMDRIALKATGWLHEKLDNVLFAGDELADAPDLEALEHSRPDGAQPR